MDRAASYGEANAGVLAYIFVQPEIMSVMVALLRSSTRGPAAIKFYISMNTYISNSLAANLSMTYHLIHMTTIYNTYRKITSE